jgi:hypothetical protein
VLRAAVGQVLTVVLRNNLSFPINLEPAGVQPVGGASAADAAAELSPAVQPGGTVTYRWTIPTDMGPGPDEPAAKLWLYRSTVDLAGHANAGLVGAMLVRCETAVSSLPASSWHGACLCRSPACSAVAHLGMRFHGPGKRAACCYLLHLAPLPPHGGQQPACLPPALCPCSNSSDVNTGDVASGQERDIITVLHILDESASPFLDANLANRTAGQRGAGLRGLVWGLAAVAARLACSEHPAA